MLFAQSTLEHIRSYLLQQLADLTIEELNEIPEGFSNSILWNLGHIVAALQGVCYRRAGLPLKIDDRFYQRYQPGSKPSEPGTIEEYENIRQLLFVTLDQLDDDLKAGIFYNYQAWTTRYGVSISNIEEAIQFLPFHEGFHIGYIAALKRAVRAKHGHKNLG